MASEPNHAAARNWSIAVFGVTILLSAFLLFQLQPLISKAILPWFGGCPAVWTTCLLFFQSANPDSGLGIFDSISESTAKSASTIEIDRAVQEAIREPRQRIGCREHVEPLRRIHLPTGDGAEQPRHLDHVAHLRGEP